MEHNRQQFLLNHFNTTNSTDPRVEQFIEGVVPTFNAWPHTGDVFYGFANGIVNVFPTDSLPQLCRGNITTVYNAVNTLFVQWSYVYPADEIKIVTDIQNLLKFPYGVTFNCYFFVYNIFIASKDPLADGILTPDEAL